MSEVHIMDRHRSVSRRCDGSLPLRSRLGPEFWKGSSGRDVSAFRSSRASRPNIQRGRHHREGLKVCGLSGGGNRIRTIGPAPAKGAAVHCQSEMAARKSSYLGPLVACRLTSRPRHHPHTPPKFAPEPAPFRLATVALSATFTGACHGRVCADIWPFTRPSVE
jgi:hypothetical protein